MATDPNNTNQNGVKRSSKKNQEPQYSFNSNFLQNQEGLTDEARQSIWDAGRVNKQDYGDQELNRIGVNQSRLLEAQRMLANDPENTALQSSVAELQRRINVGSTVQQNQNDLAGAAMQTQALNDPASMATNADVAQIDPNAKGTNINKNVGQLKGNVSIDGVDSSKANTYQATTMSDRVRNVTGNMDAAQGKVSNKAQMEGQTSDPTQMSGLELEAAQATHTQVTGAPQRVIQPDEMISGSAVDMAAVQEATDIQAAQAQPTDEAMVQGQMANLMQQFEGGQIPAWAAGAMRSATAALAARGLGSSSMAGQAIVQAAMESALPIAQADAATKAQFESQNLSNRQQAAMLGAQYRAQFLGQQFDQEFQTRVANAAKISDVSNMNFTAEQQVALENARLAQTVNIENMNARNAKVLADAAAMSQMDMANLNNRQQAAVQNAQAFLQMDMANLSNEQQIEMFKGQARVQSLFNDQAAKNAARQFNAVSENQTDQFFANLAQQTQEFNAGMRNQREQFEVQNALVIAQANAQWRQNTETINTAAQNEANLQNALQANNFTQAQLDNVWQRERDLMDYAWQSSDNAQDRATYIFLANKQIKAYDDQAKAARDAAEDEAKGYLLGRLLWG